jgi:pilus assembly protein Flp/PilA
MRLAIHRFLADDAGATMIEYGLVAALVSVAAITALQTMGESLRTIFEFVTTVSGAAAGP